MKQPHKTRDLVTRSSNRPDASLLFKSMGNKFPCYDYNEQGIKELKKHLSEKVNFLHNVGEYREIEKNIMIGPVAVLKHGADHKPFGVYAKTELRGLAGGRHSDNILGEYLGDILESPDLDADDDANARNSALYTFHVGNHEINATKNRSWLAMVNSSSCWNSANVVVTSNNSKVYYSIKENTVIKAGEQLLVYYGPAYTFVDQRFLHASNTWKESLEIFLENQDTYCPQKSTICTKLAGFLNQDASLLYAIPDSVSLTENNVDLPALAYDENEESFLPQHQQENLTSLHFACWSGDLQLVERLIQLNANTNQQTTIHGYSVLHLIALSSHSFETKQQLIQTVLQKTYTPLMLQDSRQQSALHIAIENGELDLVTFLLRLDKKYKQSSSLKKLYNSDNQDCLLSAINTGRVDIIRTAIEFYTKSEKNICMDDDDYLNQLYVNLLSVWGNDVFDEIVDLLKTSFENDKRLIKIINKILHPQPTSSTSEDKFLEQKKKLKKKKVPEQEEKLENDEVKTSLKKRKSRVTIKISEEVIDLVNNDTSFQENGEEKTDVQDILLIEDVSLPTLPTNRIHNKKILIHNYTITTMSMLQDYIDCSERLKHLSMSGLHKIMRKSSNIKYQVKKDFNWISNIFKYNPPELMFKVIFQSDIESEKIVLLLKILKKSDWFLDKAIDFTQEECFQSFWSNLKYKAIFRELFNHAIQFRTIPKQYEQVGRLRVHSIFDESNLFKKNMTPLEILDTQSSTEDLKYIDNELNYTSEEMQQEFEQLQKDGQTELQNSFASISLIDNTPIPSLPSDRIHNKKILIHQYIVTAKSILEDYKSCSEKLKNLSIANLNKIFNSVSSVDLRAIQDFGWISTIFKYNPPVLMFNVIFQPDINIEKAALFLKLLSREDCFLDKVIEFTQEDCFRSFWRRLQCKEVFLEVFNHAINTRTFRVQYEYLNQAGLQSIFYDSTLFKEYINNSAPPCLPHNQQHIAPLEVIDTQFSREQIEMYDYCHEMLVKFDLFELNNILLGLTKNRDASVLLFNKINTILSSLPIISISNLLCSDRLAGEKLNIIIKILSKKDDFLDKILSLSTYHGFHQLWHDIKCKEVFFDVFDLAVAKRTEPVANDGEQQSFGI